MTSHVAGLEVKDEKGDIINMTDLSRKIGWTEMLLRRVRKTRGKEREPKGETTEIGVVWYYSIKSSNTLGPSFFWVK